METPYCECACMDMPEITRRKCMISGNKTLIEMENIYYDQFSVEFGFTPTFSI